VAPDPCRPARRAGERGSAAVEFALVAPLVIAIALLVLQVALAVHVRTTLIAAAAEGARAAALAGAPLQAGEQRARALLEGNLAEGLVTDVRAERGVEDGQLVTSVTVQARLPLLGLLGVTTMRVTGHAIQERA